jgi:hypothetical protein
MKREPEGDKVALTREIIAAPSSQKTEGSVQVEEKMDGAAPRMRTLKVENGALLAVSERLAEGKVNVLSRPVTVLPARMEPQAAWNFRGRIAGIDLALPVRIVAKDEVQVAAGKFRAWHIHGEETGLVMTKADWWFAPGTGLVKESVVQRSPTGQLLDRHEVEMTASPAIKTAALARSEIRPFEASISTSTGGEATEIISADALQIVARWRVHRETGNAKVRAVWIAEDTGGIVPVNYKIDEANAIATPPESVGTFTLSRPADGWATGKYRIEFYVQDSLAATERITIAARAEPVSVAGEF